MDSTARLDYVLFHLTPTRTRCDLVIFSGKLNEKLAYGLLEPFIAHLRSAKDQISKGGYSVTLRPPSPANSYWFTKGTLQRFVRFVSTPEVLERFVTIEREISQLENSVKSFEASNGDGETEGNGDVGYSKTSATSVKSYSESNEKGDLAQEENSKVRLHRVVETRKVVLRKEQAMVYARALAAGFEMDNLNDLILFSDAFGASRLREACINFRDLCTKKNEDRLWVDEIAAMQAIMQPDLSFMGSSGIILAGEDNDPLTGAKQNGSTDISLSDSITSQGSSDANQENGIPASQTSAQMQNPWANQFSQYMRNFQGPMYQQMPPFQGYGFPGVQGPPHYYPANMPWPSDVNSSADRESYDRRDRKSSSKKKSKASKARGSENEEHDGNTEPSESSSETDSSSDRSHKKKSGKKSSRKVVIRNINYISSKRDADKDSGSDTDSSDEEDYLDGNSLKQQLEDAVGSFEKHQKSTSRRHRKHSGSKHSNSVNDSVDQNENKGNEGWDALQQLLLKEDSDSNVPEVQTKPVEEEYLAGKRSEEQHSSAFTPEAENGIKQKPVVNDAFLVTEKGTGSYDSAGKISGASFEHSEGYHPVMRRGAAEEFLFSKRTEEPESYTRVSVSDDASRSSVIKSQASDDWFVSKQSDEAVNQGQNTRLRFIDGDYVASSTDQVEKRTKDTVIDDSLMIHGRLEDYHSVEQGRTDISMVSDMIEASYVEKRSTEQVPEKKPESHGFYEPDELYMVRDRDTAVEQIIPSWTPEIDFENNVSVNTPSKTSDIDKSADLTSNGKGPNNKKSGDAVAKGSSRDARSRLTGAPLRRGKPEPAPGPKRSTFGSKTTTPKTQFEKDEERRKRMEELLIRREKRIAERAGGSPMTQTGKSKLQSTPEESKKPKPILRSSTIDRLAAAKTIPTSPAAQPKRDASKVKGAGLNSRSQKPVDSARR
ncbi:hypothetical protein RND81_12G208600 [Saponaria officinalis]|uniref:COP1-interacting protein 7 n=1 Tax=Saponaria officinalis TaxID=3572 RepID=A0AAW1HDB5_SAPOF